MNWVELSEQVADIWNKGGWAMWVLAVIAMTMFAVGIHVLLKLRATRFSSVPESRWRRWIDQPRERRGPIGSLIDYLTTGKTLEETRDIFAQVRMTEAMPFERDLRVMKVCVSAAPLVGLLGTVTGMLSTFGALASGGGSDQTMGNIAAGISEALVTTETGLVVALPGLFFQHQLARRFEAYKAFLTHMESVVMQVTFRRTQEEEMVERAARAKVREMVEQAVRAAG